MKALEEDSGDIQLTAAAYSRSGGSHLRLDLLDGEKTVSTLRELKPDLIIHTAAERRPDAVAADPQKAEKLNVGVVQTLAAEAEKLGAALIYISTDYVFDGTEPPYGIEASPNPLNDYGRMKLDGELIALTGCSHTIVLRVPILYGDSRDLSESAVTSIALAIKRDEQSYHDDFAIRYPTHTADVAGVIRDMARRIRSGKGSYGIFHWSAETACTKYGMALIMASVMGIDRRLILPAEPDENAAPRPENAHLDTSRLRSLGIGSERDFETEIKAIIENAE